MAWDVAVEVLLPRPGMERRCRASFRQSDREPLWVRYAERGGIEGRPQRDGLVRERGRRRRDGHSGEAAVAARDGHRLGARRAGARPPRRALPREFVLAVTGDRILALAVSPWKEGDGESVIAVRVKRDERGSWPLASVRIDGPEAGGRTAGR